MLSQVNLSAAGAPGSGEPPTMPASASCQCDWSAGSRAGPKGNFDVGSGPGAARRTFVLPAGVPVAVATVVGPLACWLVGAGAAVGVGVGPGDATSALLHPRAHHQLAPGVSTGSDAPLIVTGPGDGCCGYQREKGTTTRSSPQHSAAGSTLDVSPSGLLAARCHSHGTMVVIRQAVGCQ